MKSLLTLFCILSLVACSKSAKKHTQKKDGTFTQSLLDSEIKNNLQNKIFDISQYKETNQDLELIQYLEFKGNKAIQYSLKVDSNIVEQTEYAVEVLSSKNSLTNDDYNHELFLVKLSTSCKIKVENEKQMTVNTDTGSQTLKYSKNITLAGSEIKILSPNYDKKTETFANNSLVLTEVIKSDFNAAIKGRVVGCLAAEENKPEETAPTKTTGPI